MFILGTVRNITVIVILQLFCAQQATFAQDTISLPSGKNRAFSPDPLKATMLAVAFPGLGQVYNRKYWKIPFVYAGFGGLVYSVGFNTANYNRYMKAYQDFTDKIPATNSYIEMIKWADPSDYDPVLHPETYNPSTASWVKDRLIKGVDYYKKNRDLTYIGFAAWYLVSILDANVDASLFKFDISNNLGLDVGPAHLPVPGVTGTGLSMSLKMNF